MENYIKLCRPKGTIIIFGVPNKKFSLRLNMNFIRKYKVNITGAELIFGNDILQMFDFANANNI